MASRYLRIWLSHFLSLHYIVTQKFGLTRKGSSQRDSAQRTKTPIIPYAYLPFGNGPRNCVGMRLALMELKIALAYILKVFTPVACEKTVYPIKLKKLQLIAEDGLWVKFSVRK